MIGSHSPSRSIGAALACLFGLCAVLAGCKAIIGLEDRVHDRRLDDGGSKDGGGDSGPGGSGGGRSGNGGSGGKGGKGGSGGSVPDTDAGLDAMTPGGDAGDAMVTPDDPCELYCATVDENCNDDYAVYASQQACKGTCAKLPLGDLTAKDPLGNSVACRLDQARDAAETGEPSVHCPAAGPGGAGVCGENCESYCLLQSALCPDNDDPDCLAKCPALRDLDDDILGFEDSKFDVEKHHDGDYLQCRLVHVCSATSSPAGHCWHSELVPRAHPDPKITEPNPCLDPANLVPRCKDYCRLNFTICTGELAQYESEAQCLKLCETLDKGMTGDKGGQNTVGCRRNHSYNAMLGAPGTHCPHSGPGGHGVCGANCESYCTEVAGTCAAPFAAKYADQAACLADCNAIPNHDDPYTVAAGKTGSNKFFCRLYHTAQATESAADECAAALGGDDCASD